jgi:hypothetical protein
VNLYSTFKLLNVADTCALWNVLASPLLYRTARAAGISMSATQFVRYECLHKRGANSPEWNELRKRLRERIAGGEIVFCDIELEDLQEVASLEGRLAISKGELSSIAWAKRTGQSFFSDDKKAKRLAKSAIHDASIQDTPHLCAWLCIQGNIHEHDEGQIRADLKSLGRFLDPHISNAFRSALEIRLMNDTQRRSGPS